jgi:hypothetical protein
MAAKAGKRKGNREKGKGKGKAGMKDAHGIPAFGHKG